MDGLCDITALLLHGILSAHFDPNRCTDVSKPNENFFFFVLYNI